jgi:5-methyltetrahydrofolate--homocysteine methyltransferase
MGPDQRIHWMILHRKKEGIEEQLDAAGVRENPVRVLNEVLLPAMKEVGDKFGAGELILPFVLQSAEVMKRAVARLENYLDRIEGHTKGKVVIATVFGDVHDIGKSLVNTILTNNGYTVIDLGKQVPVETIIDKAVRVGADAIGKCAARLHVEADAVMCAGARQTRHEIQFSSAARQSIVAGRRALFVEGERPYDSGFLPGRFRGLERGCAQDPKRKPFVVKNPG